MTDLKHLSLLKLNIITSQQFFGGKLTQFFEDDSLQVLVLVLNMLESSPEAVNHLRMIIEETQPLNTDVPKSIFILLHFPSSMFFSGVYPSLFLHGWNYRYLDSLSNAADSSLINIEFWIKKVLEKSLSLNNQESDHESLKTCLYESVKSTIPLLIADFKTNKHINKTEIELLLYNEKVAGLLCDRFIEYFSANLYTKYLDDVAQAVFQHKSAINMKTQIEERVRDNFFHFIKFALSFFHIHGVTTVLADLNSPVRDFILCLIPHFPVPQFMKLADEVSHFPQAILEKKCEYHFPFFKFVFEELEALIETSVQFTCNERENEQDLQIRRIKRKEILSTVLKNLEQMMQVTT